MKRLGRIIGLFALIGFFNMTSFAITWFPEEFTCPIDSEKNTFLVVGSYGSYIYSYPSKYQWLFFPQTESPTYYICKKCHLATFMWDFDKIPKEKTAEIKKLLAEVKVSKVFKDYQEISVSERMEIMEKVYAVLDKNPIWWEQFYRIQGYHYGKKGEAAKAATSRKKSLKLIQDQLSEKELAEPKKLLLYISASLKHFLGDDKAAIEDLELGLKTKFEEKGTDPKEIKDAETGLNERMTEYISKIKSDKKPRLFDAVSDGDEH